MIYSTQKYHKIIYTIDDDFMVWIDGVEDTPTLQASLEDWQLSEPAGHLVFAGTCLGDELEFFGNEGFDFDLNFDIERDKYEH